MKDLNIGLLLRDIDDLAAQRRISENKKYDLVWRATRALESDEIDAQLTVMDIRAEIKRLTDKVMTFEDLMIKDQNNEKKWQAKVKRERKRNR